MSDYTNQLLRLISQGTQMATRNASGTSSNYGGPIIIPTVKDAMGMYDQEYKMGRDADQTAYDRRMQADALARQAEQLRYDRGQTQRNQNMQGDAMALAWQNRGPGFSPNNDGSGMVNLPQRQMPQQIYGGAALGVGEGLGSQQYVEPAYKNQANPYSPGVTNYLRQFFDSPRGYSGGNATVGTRG